MGVARVVVLLRARRAFVGVARLLDGKVAGNRLCSGCRREEQRTRKE